MARKACNACVMGTCRSGPAKGLACTSTAANNSPDDCSAKRGWSSPNPWGLTCPVGPFLMIPPLTLLPALSVPKRKAQRARLLSQGSAGTLEYLFQPHHAGSGLRMPAQIRDLRLAPALTLHSLLGRSRRLLCFLCHLFIPRLSAGDTASARHVQSQIREPRWYRRAGCELQGSSTPAVCARGLAVPSAAM
jgi:hypothetical protein